MNGIKGFVVRMAISYPFRRQNIRLHLLSLTAWQGQACRNGIKEFPQHGYGNGNESGNGNGSGKGYSIEKAVGNSNASDNCNALAMAMEIARARAI